MTVFTVISFKRWATKYWYLFVFLFCFDFSAYGQLAEIRKLQAQLPTITDSLKYIDAINRIGLLIHTRSADSCFYYAIKGKRMADRLNYTKGQAEANTNIAITLTLKGMYSQSLNSYIRARSLFLKAGEQESAAQLLMNCAITYDFLGNDTLSLRFARAAMKEAKKLKLDSVVSMMLVNYVNIDASLSSGDAKVYLDIAEKIANNYKDVRTLMFLKQVKAATLLDERKNNQALPYIIQSLKMAREHSWEYHEMEGLYLQSRYYMAMRQVDSALYCYRSIYSKAKKSKYNYWQIEILELMLNVYKEKNDVNEQLRINKLLIAALKQDNINNSNFVGDYIAYNQTQDELTKYKVGYDNKSRQTNWLIVLAVVGASLTLFLFLLYKNSRKYGRKLVALNDKVNKQNEELQQTDEFKSKLISMLAHDFRSPLGSAISMMRLVRDDDELEKEELEVLYNSIETDMQNILLTFDNILQWVKKQMAGFVYEPETLSVYNLMDEAGTMFKDVVQINNLTLVNNVPQDLSIISDKEVLQFINRNLIHNAIKFSPKGESIVLHARHEGNETIFSVEDSGSGMTQAQINALFSFNTAPTDNHNKGAGIALTICKEFVSKLHGRIWAESKPGKGTVFYFTLPD